MVIGVGIDLMEIEKIQKSIQSNIYLRKVFTEAEIGECKSVSNSAERFAGRFAAKEAFMKAIGKGIRQEIWFTQIEVLNHENGQPYIQVKGEAQTSLLALDVKNIHVSITHTRHHAAAVVILEA
jgi:holo-[acyl-carrier protein] synthase